MSEIIIQSAVTFRGRTPSVGPADALEILQHIETYDPPEQYTTRVSNVENMRPDQADGASVAFSDHVPDGFDVSEARPNLFRATYEDGSVSLGWKTDLSSVAHILDLLDHVLDITELMVGVDTNTKLSFNARLAVEFDADIDDIETPDDWLVMTQSQGQRTLVTVALWEGFTLQDSTAPVEDGIEKVRDVVAQLEALYKQTEDEAPVAVDRTPALESPTDPVEQLYRITSQPDLETEAQLLTYLRTFAHSDGLYAKMNEFNPKDDTTFVDLETTVDGDLTPGEIESWLVNHPAARYALDAEDVLEQLAGGEVALVEATVALETAGEREEQRRQHLVATENSEWKLVC